MTKPCSEAGQAGRVVLAYRREPGVFRELETRFRACSVKGAEREREQRLHSARLWGETASLSLPGCLLGRMRRNLVCPLAGEAARRAEVTVEKELLGSKACSEQAPEGQREVCQAGLLKTDAGPSEMRGRCSPPSGRGPYSLLSPSPPPF